MSVRGDPGQTSVSPLCLHWQHQVHPSGMVLQCTPTNNFTELRGFSSGHREFSVRWKGQTHNVSFCFHSLLQWLKHSRKEYCELCKHRFAFTPSKLLGSYSLICVHNNTLILVTSYEYLFSHLHISLLSSLLPRHAISFACPGYICRAGHQYRNSHQILVSLHTGGLCLVRCSASHSM